MFTGIAIGLVLLYWVFIIVGFVLWLWMLIDCITKEPSEGNDKILWVLVIIFLGPLGALIYLFARRPKRKQQFGK
jgi:cytochrome c oxidase assembly factor CtaG